MSKLLNNIVNGLRNAIHLCFLILLFLLSVTTLKMAVWIIYSNGGITPATAMSFRYWWAAILVVFSGKIGFFLYDAYMRGK